MLCVNLPGGWSNAILNKEDVKELITEIESNDNIMIADKDSISKMSSLLSRSMYQ